jgi:hypothetical protein
MTHKEALEEREKIRQVVKNWRAKDAWHEAMRDRNDALCDYVLCVNGKDPGLWEMPPVPEGVEP